MLPPKTKSKAPDEPATVPTYVPCASNNSRAGTPHGARLRIENGAVNAPASPPLNLNVACKSILQKPSIGVTPVTTGGGSTRKVPATTTGAAAMGAAAT